MKVGRPPKFKSKEELDNLISAYFLSIQNPDKPGEYIKPPTITGLAVFLDTTRETLSDYKKDDEFSDSLKRAKGKCENWVEENAMLGKANATFSIFNLKNNYGWKDRQETDITTQGDKIIPILNVQPNNSDKQDLVNDQENTNSARGDISQQDNIDSLISDSDGSVRQEANGN